MPQIPQRQLSYGEIQENKRKQQLQEELTKRKVHSMSYMSRLRTKEQ